jgi:hypothetical protein
MEIAVLVSKLCKVGCQYLGKPRGVRDCGSDGHRLGGHRTDIRICLRRRGKDCRLIVGGLENKYRDVCGNGRPL